MSVISIQREPNERHEAFTIRRIRHEAWDQGYRLGFSNAMRRMSDEPNAPTTPNPYRSPDAAHAAPTSPTSDEEQAHE